MAQSKRDFPNVTVGAPEMLIAYYPNEEMVDGVRSALVELGLTEKRDIYIMRRSAIRAEEEMQQPLGPARGPLVRVQASAHRDHWMLPDTGAVVIVKVRDKGVEAVRRTLDSGEPSHVKHVPSIGSGSLRHRVEVKPVGTV
jgi:hypothetical protein